MQIDSRQTPNSKESGNKKQENTKQYQRKDFFSLIVNEENSYSQTQNISIIYRKIIYLNEIQKGLGLVIAAFITITFFLGFPIVGKNYVYPSLMKMWKYFGWEEDWQVFAFGSMLFNLVYASTINLTYIIIYKLGLPLTQNKNKCFSYNENQLNLQFPQVNMFQNLMLVLVCCLHLNPYFSYLPLKNRFLQIFICLLTRPLNIEQQNFLNMVYIIKSFFKRPAYAQTIKRNVIIYHSINSFYRFVVIYGFFEQYKVNSELWPWQEKSEEKQKEWKELRWKIFKTWFSYYFFLLPTIYLFFLDLSLAAVKGDNWQSPFRHDLESFPTSKEIFFQILFCVICEDFTFHFTHKLMHWKYIYPYVHKKHHEIKVNIAQAYVYFSIIDFLLGSILPSSVGQTILGKQMHYFTYLIWVTIRIAESMDGHSGYEFPWSPFRLIPFSASSTYHDFHHSNNIGNYSSFFTIWDTVFGSNKVFYRYQARLQAEKSLIVKKEN